jgi:hypothetical protein
MIFFTKQTDVIAISEQSCIHFDPSVNSDISRQYEKWLADGNKPQEWQSEMEGE